MKRILLWLGAALLFSSAQSQQRPLGTWRSYFQYSSSSGVVDAGDRVYSASPRSVFSYAKADGAISILDKVSGLSDVQVTNLCFNNNENALVIAYENTNIDVVKNHTDIYNLPDLKNKTTPSSKVINSISAFDKYAYVACDLGILEIDLAQTEVKNNYVIGNGGANVRVADVAVNIEYIFAVTQNGLKRATKNGSNLLDYSSWVLENGTNGLPQKIDSTQGLIAAFGNAFVLSSFDTLYLFQNNQWQLLSYEPYWKTRSLRVQNNRLYVCQRRDSSGTISDVRFIEMNPDFSTTILYPDYTARPVNGFRDNSGWWFIADEWNGLMRLNNPQVEFITPNGPRFSGSNKVFAANDGFYVASAAFNNFASVTYNYDGFAKFSNGNWQSFNSSQMYPADGDKFIDAYCVVHNESRNKTYLGTVGGLVEYDDYYGIFNTYDPTNSSLGSAVGDVSRCKISAMCLDGSGNLWVANMQAAKPLAVFTSSGQWYSFSVPNAGIIRSMTFDNSGQLWCAGSQGLLVYSPGDDISLSSDDAFRLLSTTAGNGALPHNTCNTVVNDKNGDIWVGTSEGIATFYCPGSVLTTNGCDADKIKVVRDGFVDYLFKSERVQAMKVDGGNRKWVGTENGVWLISADGKDEVMHFDVDNSPLPSNLIYDIDVSKNGEVLLATSVGLVSYWGNATYGDATPNNVMVFPNPVDANYDGDIAIRGLVDDAYVKITDTRGTLVYQASAFGGQMIWNGRGYDGTRAATGVYLVFSSDDLGKNRCVAKIVLQQ